MKRSITIAAALGLALSTGLIAQGRDGSTDRLTISGGSTVRDWSCEATDVRTDFRLGGAGPTVAGLPSGAKSLVVTIPVEGIDCNNGTMNGHLRKALKADQAPNVRYEMTGYALENGGIVAQGELSVAGKTTPVTLDLTAEPVPGGVRVVGTKELNMRELGVTPPSLMLGTMKVRDMVKIRFDVVLDTPTAVAIGAVGN